MAHHHIVDERARVCASKNEAELDQFAVVNELVGFLQLVGVDGKSLDVAVLNSELQVLCLLGFVEETIGVDPVFTGFQDGVTKHVFPIPVLVHPHQRDLLAIEVFESPGGNRPTIQALQTHSSGVTTEVILHWQPLPCLRRLAPPVDQIRMASCPPACWGS